MMSVFQGIFFLVLGVGLVFVSWQSLKTGRLPYGPRRFVPDIMVSRTARPMFFWILFVGYGAAGVWMTVFALRLLAGTSDPLPLS